MYLFPQLFFSTFIYAFPGIFPILFIFSIIYIFIFARIRPPYEPDILFAFQAESTS